MQWWVRIRLVAIASASLLVAMAASAGCSPEPSTGEPIRVVVIGDSYTGGSGEGGRGAAAWPRIAGEDLRGDGMNAAVAVSAHGGSGYVARGIDGSTFSDAVPGLLQPDDDVVVVFGGINDADKPVEQESVAVGELLSEVRRRSPDAEVIVVGPAWPDAEPTRQILSVRDVLSAAATAAGATFIDPIADRWFADRPDLIGDDGIHPTDEGHRLMAQKLEPYLRSALSATQSN